MLRISKKDLETLENKYVGISAQIMQFENATLKPCLHCKSDNTALVQVGIIGRTIHIAAATIRMKLVSNPRDRLGKFFCNGCGKFFN